MLLLVCFASHNKKKNKKYTKRFFPTLEFVQDAAVDPVCNKGELDKDGSWQYKSISIVDISWYKNFVVSKNRVQKTMPDFFLMKFFVNIL